MKYEEALVRWGAETLGLDSTEGVVVDFDYDEGYNCCGGTDPLCYCSYAESPSFNVIVTGGGKTYKGDLKWDMASFLKELFEVADRT